MSKIVIDESILSSFYDEEEDDNSTPIESGAIKGETNDQNEDDCQNDDVGEETVGESDRGSDSYSTSRESEAINEETNDQNNDEEEDCKNDEGGEETIVNTDHERDSERRKQLLFMASTDAEQVQDLAYNDHSGVKFSEKKPLHMTDTWEEITKRDRSMSDRNLVHVVDHSMAMLGERICEATTDNSFRYCLKAFEQSLGRFRNSEIELGKRISSGSFADIYLIRSFRRGEDTDGTAFTQDQARSVHRVKQSDPDKYVVKVLRKNLLINTNLFATGAADFITEGTLLASFDHPNIISIRGRSMHGVEGFSSGKRDSVFFVLERVDGDLTDKLREWKKRTSKQGLFAKGRKSFNASLLRERLALMADLAAALSYLHERHVIHRDVALSNVGISAGEGQVKLLDFGLAKVLPFSKNENERFLLTGKTGSMRYMAPEISLKQPYNLKADVYSFAILLHEVLSLEKVFTNWQSQEIVQKIHHKKQRPRMSMFWSQRIKELLRCCWHDNPDDRLAMNYVEAVLQKELRDLQLVDSSTHSRG